MGAGPGESAFVSAPRHRYRHKTTRNVVAEWKRLAIVRSHSQANRKSMDLPCPIPGAASPGGPAAVHGISDCRVDEWCCRHTEGVALVAGTMTTITRFLRC